MAPHVCTNAQISPNREEQNDPGQIVATDGGEVERHDNRRPWRRDRFRRLKILEIFLASSEGSFAIETIGASVGLVANRVCVRRHQPGIAEASDSFLRNLPR